MNMQRQKVVDGNIFERLILSGAANLKAHADTVNQLNVFPIPDGDTGENMCMTINGGIAPMKKVEKNSVSEKAKALSEGMLLSARGNSGVILAQLFRGLAKGLESKETVDLENFATAFRQGVQCAYDAVVQPVEGTILTVAREATEYAKDRINADSTVESFVLDYLTEAKASLKRTPELLGVLKEAGVTDSGGAGLMYIAEGMLYATQDNDVKGEVYESVKTVNLDFGKFTEDSEMEYGYCTEFLLRLQRSKTDLTSFTTDIFIDYLSGIGDSIVAFLTGTILKVHVHTMTPWKVLEFAQRYGEFLTVKIENMTLQHNEINEESRKKTEVEELRVRKARKKFGLVTVATGEGIVGIFKECGADVVIEGGQGKNPSTDDFLHAFDEVNADYIFVLPNNGNIILAARQAADLYEGSEIIIVESKNVGQAYSALSLLDYSSDDPGVIADKLKQDMQGVATGMITRSVRDAVLNGVEIESDDFIGFTDKTMLVSRKDKTDAVCGLIDKMGIEEKEYCILVYGQNGSENDCDVVRDYVCRHYPKVEFYSVYGGQEVYDFIVILQ